MAETLYDPAGRAVQAGSPTERTRLLARGYSTRDPNPPAEQNQAEAEPQPTETRTSRQAESRQAESRQAESRPAESRPEKASAEGGE